MNLPVPSSSSISNVVPSSKYLDLARKIKEIEIENAKLAIKLEKSNQHLFRLRLERNILMEKLMSIEPKLTPHTTTDGIKEEILKEMDNELSEAEDNEEN